MDFTSNYFEIFGLPVSYQIDLALLADRYHDMQKEFHPETHITHDPLFLMRQIELREALSELREAEEPFAELEAVAQDVSSQYVELQETFDRQYHQADFQNAIETVAKMQFFSKLLKEAEQLEQELDN